MNLQLSKDSEMGFPWLQKSHIFLPLEDIVNYVSQETKEIKVCLN